MIRISLGNVGSGKTVCEVREMFLNQANRKTFSNIKTRLKNQIDISPKMIIKQEIVDYKKSKKKENLEPVYKYSLNKEYWQSLKEPCNVVLDEAHSIINSRRAMSKINIIMNDWLALIRRVLGASESGEGTLVYITQLPNRIDVVARDMCHQVRYHICHYRKMCKKCFIAWDENSEIPEPLHQCPMCNSFNITKFSHKIEVYHFSNMDNYNFWRATGQKTFYKRYVIPNIEKFFPLYDTLQWDNMFSEFY